MTPRLVYMLLIRPLRTEGGEEEWKAATASGSDTQGGPDTGFDVVPSDWVPTVVAGEVDSLVADPILVVSTGRRDLLLMVEDLVVVGGSCRAGSSPEVAGEAVVGSSPDFAVEAGAEGECRLVVSPALKYSMVVFFLVGTQKVSDFETRLDPEAEGLNHHRDLSYWLWVETATAELRILKDRESQCLVTVSSTKHPHCRYYKLVHLLAQGLPDAAELVVLSTATARESLHAGPSGSISQRKKNADARSSLKKSRLEICSNLMR